MPRTFPPEQRENTEISADFTQSDDAGTTTLSGNVIIEKHLLRLTADKARYDSDTELLTIEGNVHIDTDTMSMDADNGIIDLSGGGPGDGEQGSSTLGMRQNTSFTDIRFLIPESRMKGFADVITEDQAEDGHRLSILQQAGITSCNLLNPDWLISSDEIELDHDEEYGYADDVVIRFKDVPILYTPYIEFPTSNRRRSGLLFPELGTSSSRGAELAVPWYWNIAPNQDAILTPRFMEKRGTGLGADYRYLTRSTNGELRGDYLPDDDITGDDRYQVRYQQHTDIADNLLLDIDVQDISDSNYFNDFSNSLGTTSQTHLDRNIHLRYALQDWQFSALAQDIKTIDNTTPPADRPYKRLPQITLSGTENLSDSGLRFDLNSELVNFAHDTRTLVTGNRFTVQPGISLPLSGLAWFFTPSVKYHFTSYDTGFEDDSLPDEEADGISVPIASIDSGLFFERYLNDGLQQTLEPRLFYVHIPFDEQSNNPIFDTRLPEFSVSRLFSENRFVGGDRVGDTNQITAALTSRVIDTGSGQELVKASIGQIFYFEDRQVTIGAVPDTSSYSDIIMELDTRAGNWQGSIDLQVDPDDSRLARQNYFMHYKSDARHLFNLGYRQRQSNVEITLEQIDTSFAYAINNQYTAFVRWNHSLLYDETFDTIAGLSYDSCCWSIQLLGQRRIQNTRLGNNNQDRLFDNSVLLQFVFKGLGSLSGNKARNTLQESIFGYEDVLQ